MATTKYEVTYIIKPDVDEDNKKALVETTTRLSLITVVLW